MNQDEEMGLKLARAIAEKKNEHDRFELGGLVVFAHGFGRFEAGRSPWGHALVITKKEARMNSNRGGSLTCVSPTSRPR